MTLALFPFQYCLFVQPCAVAAAATATASHQTVSRYERLPKIFKRLLYF